MHSTGSTTSPTSRPPSRRTRAPRSASLPPSFPEAEELAAQRLVCDALVRSCERGLFELRCSLGRATAPAEVRAGLRAADLLETVLGGWRETRDAIGGRP